MYFPTQKFFFALTAVLSLATCASGGKNVHSTLADNSLIHENSEYFIKPESEEAKRPLVDSAIRSNMSNREHMASPLSRIGPASIGKALREHPESQLPFIITTIPGEQAKIMDSLGDNARWLEPFGKSRSRLDLIDAFFVEIPASLAISISNDPSIRQIWYVPKDLIKTYVGIVLGFEHILKLKRDGYHFTVVNISLAPPPQLMPIEMSGEEPMHRATKIAADADILTVFAIGNYFDSTTETEGVVNPWCLPEWVVCVGAANEAATSLWSRSARGYPDIAETWPDVVAWGVDALAPEVYSTGDLGPLSESPVPAAAGNWVAVFDQFIGKFPRTEKESYRKAYDESHPTFLARIPKEKFDQYTLVTGTSFATTRVTTALMQIYHFLIERRKNTKVMTVTTFEGGTPLTFDPIGDDTLSIKIPLEVIEKKKLLEVKRLVGKLEYGTDGSVVVTYPVRPLWKVAKQILMDTAVSMNGYGPHEVGAGFVYIPYYAELFGQYGIEHHKKYNLHVSE